MDLESSLDYFLFSLSPSPLPPSAFCVDEKWSASFPFLGLCYTIHAIMGHNGLTALKLYLKQVLSSCSCFWLWCLLQKPRSNYWGGNSLCMWVVPPSHLIGSQTESKGKKERVCSAPAFIASLPPECRRSATSYLKLQTAMLACNDEPSSHTINQKRSSPLESLVFCLSSENSNQCKHHCINRGLHWGQLYGWKDDVEVTKCC